MSLLGIHVIPVPAEGAPDEPFANDSRDVPPWELGGAGRVPAMHRMKLLGSAARFGRKWQPPLDAVTRRWS